jgi:V-type H+-transporting ATPase proteolipid subunit
MGFFYLYYALGLPTFLIIIIALYLLFTGANSSCYDPF